MLTIDPVRLGSALALSASYLAMCAAIWRMRAAARRPLPPGGADWLVVYASQTGSAEYLAERSAALLATGGLSARAVCISALDAGALAKATRVLFIASTRVALAKATPRTAPRASPARSWARRPSWRICTTRCWRWATAAMPTTADSAAH